jgi:hypothetical protein
MDPVLGRADINACLLYETANFSSLSADGAFTGSRT